MRKVSIFEGELRMATAQLPTDLSTWMRRALNSGWFDITSGSYDSGGESHCPVAAAATLAGAWVNGGITGKPEWGTPDGPGPQVENFAAYFDLVSEDTSLDSALAIVIQELGVTPEMAVAG